MKLDMRKEIERMEECTTEATHTLYEQSQPPSAEVCRLLCGVFGSALRVDAVCDSFRLQFTSETHECTVVSVHESYDPELSKRHEWLAKHLHGFKREMVFRCVPERNIDVVLKHGLLGLQAEPLDEEELLCVTSDVHVRIGKGSLALKMKWSFTRCPFAVHIYRFLVLPNDFLVPV